MITRWEEIAKRAAAKLGLPYEKVRAAVEDMAKKTAEHASHPTVLETDLLGIGTLETRYGKLMNRIKVLASLIKTRTFFMERQLKRGLKEDLINAAKYKAAIELYTKDIEVFNSFIDLKADILRDRGRRNWLTKLMTENDLTLKDFPNRKKKSSMVEDSKPKVKVKPKPKEPVLRNGKRRAKRIKGWIHPDLR